MIEPRIKPQQIFKEAITAELSAMDLERLQPESRQSVVSVQRAGCPEIFRRCLVADALDGASATFRRAEGIGIYALLGRPFPLKNTAAPCMVAPKA